MGGVTRVAIAAQTYESLIQMGRPGDLYQGVCSD